MTSRGRARLEDMAREGCEDPIGREKGERRDEDDAGRLARTSNLLLLLSSSANADEPSFFFEHFFALPSFPSPSLCMAPRIPLPLASLRRSASTVSSSVLPSSSSASLSVVQSSATEAILRDVRATIISIDETVSKESPWPARLEEASRRLQKLGGGRGVGELPSEEMEIAGELVSFSF